MKIPEEWQNPFEIETDLIRSLWLLIATLSSASLDEAVAFSCSLGQRAAKLPLQGDVTDWLRLWKASSSPYPSRHKSFFSLQVRGVLLPHSLSGTKASSFLPCFILKADFDASLLILLPLAFKPGVQPEEKHKDLK